MLKMQGRYFLLPFHKQKTDLNINVGLCLGHELLFEQHSAAPVTTFLVKDFATGHKTVENLI